jgi:FHA domain-containing protein
VPILRDFERRLGGLVEGLFAKTFRSGLQPVELAKRVLKEMDAGRTVGVSEVWAPNAFEFRLSSFDADRFEQAEAALVTELKEVVRENASERGWGLVGPPEITFETDPSLKKGEFRCRASLVEGEEKVEPASPSAASLVIHEDGETHSIVLAAETMTIGRSPECQIAIADKGASRRHAQVRRKKDTYTLTDLGSTNGTRLNGQTIQARELSDGDRITIGSTLIEFRQGSA